MVSQAQKRQMMDYVVAGLQGSESRVEPVRKSIVDGINSSYILMGEDGIVFLVDQFYPNDALRRVNEAARRGNKQRIAYLFFKDGKTFFRNAAHGEEAGLEGKRYKSKFDLSLKDYTDEQVNRMINFRPEENFVFGIRNGRLHYYQQESPGLSQGIEGLSFVPVTFDYSHLDFSQRFGPSERDSARLRMWIPEKRAHYTAPLVLHGNVVISKARAEELRARQVEAQR